VAIHRQTGRRLLALPIIASLLAGLGPLAAPLRVAAAPAAPTLISPAYDDSVASNPAFEWSAVGDAVKYHIEVSASATFAAPLLVTDDTANLRYTPIVELPLGTIYWRVAAKDVANVQGPFATGQFTRTWNTAPSPMSPAAGAVLTFPTDPLLFTWGAMAGAQSYELQVDDDDAFVGATAIPTKNTSYVVSEPKTVGQVFYWHVRGVSGGIYSAWSSTFSFTIQWPSVPALLYPAANQQLTDLYFSWTAVPGAATYDLQVSPNGDWANNLTVNQTAVMGTRYAPPRALNNGSYFWRVRARDAATTPNNGAWSEERQFQRAWSPRPVLQSPSNAAFVSTPTFTWTPIEHAAYYEFQYSKDINFYPDSDTTWSCYTAHTSLTPYVIVLGGGEPGACTWMLFPGTTYYWHVRGVDPPVLNPGAGEPGVLGLWSNTSNVDTWSFTFLPAFPTPVAPANGATVDQPTVAWADAPGASRYLVTILKSDGTQAASAPTYATSWTPTTALDPTDSPFQWYVQAYDFLGHPGVIPGGGLRRTFTLSASTPTAARPEQVGPADLASSVDVPSLSWTPVVGATQYQVWYSTNGAVFQKMGSTTRAAAYTYAADSITSGTYWWYVQALNSGGAQVSTSSDLRRFVITQPDLLGTSDYTAPARCTPGAPCAALADTPTLTWNAVPGASAYRVYVAQDPNFTNAYRTYLTAFTQLTPREAYEDSQAGEAFYWFVRPIRDQNTGRFDSEAELNASAFQKRSEGIHRTGPADGAHVDNLVTFSWEDFLTTNQGLAPAVGQEARQYYIQISYTADFAHVEDDQYVDTPFYTPYDMTYEKGPIYWRVAARDGSSPGNLLTTSSVGLVQKESPLVQLSYPADAASVTGTPYLRWDPQDFAASYDVQLDEDANFSSPTSITTKMTAWAYTEPLAARTYYWKVRRNDADNRDGPWSAVRSFVLSPTAPTLTSPADGANPSPTALILQWTSSIPSPKYSVEVSASSTFAGMTSGFPVSTVMTQFAPKTILGNGTYYWRVKALNATGTAVATSAARSFTVDSSRPSVSALNPASSAALSSSFTVTFSEAVTGVDGSTFAVTPSGGSPLAGSVSVLSPTSARFTPAALLVPGQTYVVALNSSITDSVGNPLLPYSANVRADTSVQQSSPAVTETWGRWAIGSANGGAMKVARTPGSRLTFTFDGTAVSLVGFRGPSGGYASVVLDGVQQVASLNFFASKNQFRRVLWSKGGLAAGSHTLQVTAKGTKTKASKGTWVYVDAFVVGGVARQENDPAVRDAFRAITSGSASGSSYDVASHISAKGMSGASLTFQFRGTGITWLATKGNTYGKAVVFIDNVKKATVDLYRSKVAYRQPAWTSPTLGNALHTIRIVALGSKQKASKGYDVSFDSFTIK
jgi:hypothetical protein